MTSKRLVCVHGFTQTRHSWLSPAAAIAARLGDGYTIASLDAPGHGRRAAERLDLETGADALVDRGGPGIWIGYSMGARFCLHAALRHRHVVERLVLISGTPGIENDHDRRLRRVDDERRADRIEAIGVEAFIDEWLRLPLLTTLPLEAADVPHRLTNTIDGLSSSLRLAGTGTQEPLWNRLAEISMPTLVLAGARDRKFADIGSRMAASIPRAEFHTVEDAGHTVHLEQPDRTADIVAGWLLAAAE